MDGMTDLERAQALAYHSDRLSGLSREQAGAGLVTADPSLRTPWDDAAHLDEAVQAIEAALRASPYYDPASDTLRVPGARRRLT